MNGSGAFTARSAGSRQWTGMRVRALRGDSGPRSRQSVQRYSHRFRILPLVGGSQSGSPRDSRLAGMLRPPCSTGQTPCKTGVSGKFGGHVGFPGDWGYWRMGTRWEYRYGDWTALSDLRGSGKCGMWTENGELRRFAWRMRSLHGALWANVPDCRLFAYLYPQADERTGWLCQDSWPMSHG